MEGYAIVVPGTVRRSPFAREVLLEDLTDERIAALIRRLTEKEELLMAAQDDIAQAVATLQGVADTFTESAASLVSAANGITSKLTDLQAQGVDTTALTAAVAAVPDAAAQLASAVDQVNTLAQPAPAPADAAAEPASTDTPADDSAPADLAQPTLDEANPTTPGEHQ